MNSGIFNRDDDYIGVYGDELTDSQYNMAIGGVLLWGFAVNAVTCTLFKEAVWNWNPQMILIGYFMSAFIGIMMSAFSKNALVSFIGYNLVVLPVGIVLTMLVGASYSGVVGEAFIITSAVVAVMIVVAGLKADLFESLGPVLGLILLVVIIAEVILGLTRHSLPEWWDILIVGLFSCYIGYDWSKAQSKARTMDNAVDSAVELYLDIVNIFIRVLSIMGKRRR